MDESDILQSIRRMVADEHAIRSRIERGQTDRVMARAELCSLQESLDQCWDLLRQRRARQEFQLDPEQAQLRPKDVIERYWS
jgi:hypothetical protein